MLKMVSLPQDNFPIAYHFLSPDEWVYSGLRFGLPTFLMGEIIGKTIALSNKIPLSEVRRIRLYDLQTTKAFPVLLSGTFQYDRIEISDGVDNLTRYFPTECPEEVYKEFKMLIGDLEPFPISDKELRKEKFAEIEFNKRGFQILTPQEARKRGYTFNNATHTIFLFDFLGLFLDSPLRDFILKKYVGDDLNDLAMANQRFDISNTQFAIVSYCKDPRLMGQAAGFRPGEVKRCRYSLWPTEKLAERIRQKEETGEDNLRAWSLRPN